MVGVTHDGRAVRRVGGAAAVDFQPNFDARVVGRAATGFEGAADLLERPFGGDVGGQVVGAHLDALAAEVRGESDELPAGFDLALDDVLVRRMELARRAAAPDLDAGVGEALAHFTAGVTAQAWLDAVLVRGAQLNAGDADRAADAQHGRHVPRRRDVVSDGAQLETRLADALFARTFAGGGC